VTPGAVAAAANFVGLLEATWGFPNMYVAAYLRSLSPAPFNAMKFGDFILQKVKDVFPGGATDPNWVTIDAGLTKIIGSECYSQSQSTKVTAIVVNANKLVTDVVNQISVLG
jgi:hypothetical protein